MSKAPQIYPQHKLDILHLLEYCRLDRAADLLGCEVCDLLHLNEVFKIDLYWKFEGQPAETIKGSISWNDYDSMDNSFGFFAVDTYAHAIEEYTGEFDDAHEAFLADKNDDYGEIPIRLFGLWDATDRPSQNDEEGRQVVCWGRRMRVQLPEQWQAPPDNELYIMRGELIRLRKAIASGEQLEKRDPSANSARDHQVKQAAGRKTRESTKPYRALVKMMEVIGFTQEDFRGSIPALQAKLANKGLGGELTSIDEKTLAEWLRRAGVR